MKKNAKILSFEEIIKIVPEEIFDYLIRCGRTLQSLNWHPEGHVFKHIQIVYERAMKTGDIDLVLAALFHDLGKADVSRLNSKGAWSAHGHEHISANLVEKHKDWINSIGADAQNVYDIVKHHMRIKYFDVMRSSKRERLKGMKVFDKLKLFFHLDDMKKEMFKV